MVRSIAVKPIIVFIVGFTICQLAFIGSLTPLALSEGLRLADQFAVDSYPTLLFIDDSGQILRKSEGFLDAGQLLELADKVKIKK